MKPRHLAAAAICICALYLATQGWFEPVVSRETPAYRALAQLPVYEGGRLKPLDSLARNACLLLRAKQTALDSDGRRVPALTWLLDAMLAPAQASARYRVFRVDNPDLLSLLDQPGSEPRHFTYAELEPKFALIDHQASRAPEEAAQQTVFDRAVLQLRQRLIYYQVLTETVRPARLEGPVAPAYAAFHRGLRSGWAQRDPRSPGADLAPAEYAAFLDAGASLQQMSQRANHLVIPPPAGSPEGTLWRTTAQALADSWGEPQVDAIPLAWAQLADAHASGQPSARLAAVQALLAAVETRAPQGADTRPAVEEFFNRAGFFSASMGLYVFTFLLTAVSWLVAPAFLSRWALRLLAATWVLHTAGLALRVYLTGYAPVTNLYSSAVFIGWAAVPVCLLIERRLRSGIGTAVASGLGFCTLIIAHHLAANAAGDTMEMMRAVLDSNFWLTTHVITVTVGYSATFVAGALAIAYICLGLASRRFAEAEAGLLERMVYGVTCFALFFSFVGTVLGGIWADQSWGRFWGWDPKENGALLIVIWNALILHARRIRMCSPRGLMQLSVCGNIVTSWSWFGTNMLGIGLHSYGFMDSAFAWLVLFWVSQLGLITLAALPPKCWRAPVAATWH